MKKYIIRANGWAYNDFTYQNDGLHQIVTKFEDKNECISYLKYLNREYIIRWFNFIDKYEFETWTDFKSDYKKSKNELSDFLVEEFDFNPTIKIHPSLHDYDLSMFVTRPSNIQLDKLVKKTKVDFFKMVEVDNRVTYFKAKINQKYTNHHKYLMDYDYVKELYFSSSMEAMIRFREMYFEDFNRALNNNDFLHNTLSELSSLPDVLRDFINDNKYLKYQNNHLKIQEDIDSETLLKLNSLLKIPFLLFEDIKFLADIDNQFEKNDIKGIVTENFEEWQEIQEYYEKYNSLEQIKNSKEYLRLFYLRLPLDEKRYNYSKIIIKNLSKILNTEIKLNHEQLSDGENIFSFSGVAKKCIKMNGEFHIESIFGFNSYRYLEESQIGSGKGKHIVEAFESSLEDWFQKNKELVFKLVKEKN